MWGDMSTIKIIILDKPGSKRVVVPFTKKGEEIEILGLVIGDQKGKYNLDLVVDHKVGQNKGKIEIRGIVKNGADVRITGMIKIVKEAHLVDDFLEIRLLVLDDYSRAEVVPMLEIEANDVKVSHAVSVGKLDESQVYYLMSRGIERARAEEMLIEGFLEPVRSRMVQ